MGIALIVVSAVCSVVVAITQDPKLKFVMMDAALFFFVVGLAVILVRGF